MPDRLLCILCIGRQHLLALAAKAVRASGLATWVRPDTQARSTIRFDGHQGGGFLNALLPSIGMFCIFYA
jgi:hypothetical protein